jgi:hypothetical protein
MQLVSRNHKVTARIYNEEHQKWATKEIVSIARGILSGELGIVAGARQLAAWRFDVGADKDPDFIFFVGIESETDEIPIGDVRSRWNPEALKAKDAELQRFEASVRDKAVRACQKLIEKYEVQNG